MNENPGKVLLENIKKFLTEIMQTPNLPNDLNQRAWGILSDMDTLSNIYIPPLKNVPNPDFLAGVEKISKEDLYIPPIDEGVRTEMPKGFLSGVEKIPKEGLYLPQYDENGRMIIPKEDFHLPEGTDLSGMKFPDIKRPEDFSIPEGVNLSGIEFFEIQRDADGNIIDNPGRPR